MANEKNKIEQNIITPPEGDREKEEKLMNDLFSTDDTKGAMEIMKKLGL